MPHNFRLSIYLAQIKVAWERQIGGENTKTMTKKKSRKWRKKEREEEGISKDTEVTSLRLHFEKTK